MEGLNMEFTAKLSFIATSSRLDSIDTSQPQKKIL